MKVNTNCHKYGGDIRIVLSGSREDGEKYLTIHLAKVTSTSGNIESHTEFPRIFFDISKPGMIILETWTAKLRVVQCKKTNRIKLVYKY